MWPWAGASKCQNQSVVCCSSGSRSRATSVSSAQNQCSGASPSPSGCGGAAENVLMDIKCAAQSRLVIKEIFFSSFFGGTNKCLAGSLCAERLQNKFHSCRQNNLLCWGPGEWWVKTGVVHSLSHVTQALLHTTGRYESKALDSECRLHLVSFT